MSTNAPTTLKARIESRWAAGQRMPVIAQELGTTLRYVEDVCYWASRRPKPLGELQGDDEAHVAAISLSNGGMGFPYCVAPQATGRAA